MRMRNKKRHTRRKYGGNEILNKVGQGWNNAVGAIDRILGTGKKAASGIVSGIEGVGSTAYGDIKGVGSSAYRTVTRMGGRRRRHISKRRH